ncbi:hypothetical protein EK21DRAFT_115074 [Setomelanomma holmii]|uniref:Uncharacterized protein n=1 Tax=Setomelanomma holmii TaxID=210430 RepID=A0A9P4LK16_9PLEO|nr:hypothetical protein EK21DRAFT_115074 [Setomelanomma holmii]
MTGKRGGHGVDDTDLAQFVSGSRHGGIFVSSHKGIKDRSYKNAMSVEHDQNTFMNNPPANQCLVSMIGPAAARWLGGYVAHGWKYQAWDEKETWDEENKALGADFPLIAVDLDTTSLGPLIAYLTWYAENEPTGGLY